MAVEEQPGEIRAWAGRHGMAVSDRGRLPRAVREAWVADRTRRQDQPRAEGERAQEEPPDEAAEVSAGVGTSAGPRGAGDRPQEQHMGARRWTDLLKGEVPPRLLTVFSLLTSLLTVVLAVATYSYRLGFYESFGLSPEDVGFSQADALLRVGAIVSVTLIGSVAIILLIMGMIRFILSTGDFEKAPRGLWAAVFLLAAPLFVSEVDYLSHPSRAKFAFLAAGSALWLVLLLTAIGPRSSSLRVARPTFMQGKCWGLALRSSRAVVAAYVVVALTGAPFALYSAAHRDARSLMTSARSPYVSLWQQYFGPRVERLQARWVSTQDAPLTNADAQPALLLGVADGVTTVFDLTTCRVLRLPSAAVALSQDVGLDPTPTPTPTPTAEAARPAARNPATPVAIYSAQAPTPTAAPQCRRSGS